MHIEFWIHNIINFFFGKLIAAKCNICYNLTEEIAKISKSYEKDRISMLVCLETV